jgi:Fe-S-cluster containining protein
MKKRLLSDPMRACTFQDPWQPISNRPYFFDSGICFECRRCGRCCCGEPGIVHVDATDMDRIAGHIGQPKADFLARFVLPYPKGHRIAEKPDGRCLFYQDGCTIYPVRPLQCRTYPFWFQNLRSEKKWGQTCKACPGIGQGRRHSKAEILALLQLTDWHRI